MMKWPILFVFIMNILFLQAQDSIKMCHWELNGYLSNVQSAIFSRVKGDWVTDQVVHNRLNFKWMPFEKLTVAAEARNRFIYGQMLQVNPMYASALETGSGLFDLSTNLSEGKSFVLNTTVDRLYADYQQGSLQITLGRQRINWGQCYAWNPNDLFNTYSFFDIDYEEKPGCDALRLQYYPSPVSAVEMAATADSSKKITCALLSRFNKYGYDFQFLAAWYRQYEVAAGAGWSGNIYNLGFRGEATVFIPTCRDSTSTALFSAGLDYVFTNSLYLNVEFLYNQHSVSLSDPAAFVTGNIFSPKNISFSEYNALFQVSYPITPLFNTSVATMYFPDFDGFFISPSISYSLSANSAVSVASQSFGGKFFGNNTMSYMHFVYLRLKLNF